MEKSNSNVRRYAYQIRNLCCGKSISFPKKRGLEGMKFEIISVVQYPAIYEPWFAEVKNPINVKKFLLPALPSAA